MTSISISSGTISSCTWWDIFIIIVIWNVSLHRLGHHFGECIGASDFIDSRLQSAVWMDVCINYICYII
jgi:hypothetical protein